MQRKENQLPPLLNGDKEKTFFCAWGNAWLQLLVLICLWITVSHLFICLFTLKLTTFEQESKECDHIEQRSVHLAKRKCNLCGWLKQHQGNLHSFFLNLFNLRNFFGVRTKVKESIFKNNNRINFTAATRTSVLSTKWIRTRPSAGLVSKWKNGGGLRLFEW